MIATATSVDLLDAVIYGDVFDCAVTLDEIWRYGRTRVERDELRGRLAAVAGVLRERDGMYCLRGREALLDARAERIARARALQRQALRVARVLRHAPFVRVLVLTGSVAADDAGPGADVDLLVVVARGRLATVFLALAPVSRLLGRRLFCPNYYVSEDHLDFAGTDVYVERELAQMQGLAGAVSELRQANSWLGSAFPNLEGCDRVVPSCGGRLQRSLEAPFRGRLGDAVERRARRVATARLRAHYGRFGATVPAAVIESLDAEIGLRFHARLHEGRVGERYERRRSEVAALLDGGSTIPCRSTARRPRRPPSSRAERSP